MIFVEAFCETFSAADFCFTPIKAKNAFLFSFARREEFIIFQAKALIKNIFQSIFICAMKLGMRRKQIRSINNHHKAIGEEDGDGMVWMWCDVSSTENLKVKCPSKTLICSDSEKFFAGTWPFKPINFTFEDIHHPLRAITRPGVEFENPLKLFSTKISRKKLVGAVTGYLRGWVSRKKMLRFDVGIT